MLLQNSHEDARPRLALAPRTPDHGRPLPPPPRHRRRRDARPSRRPELLDRAHAAARPRGERPRHARGGRAALCLRAGRPPPGGAQIGAPPSRRDVLRRIGREPRRRGARQRSVDALRRRARSHRPARRRGAQGGPAMTPIDVLLRVSLVLAIAWLLAAASRRQAAALRHWILAIGLLGAALEPAVARLAPVWHLPHAPAVAVAPSQPPAA